MQPTQPPEVTLPPKGRGLITDVASHLPGPSLWFAVALALITASGVVFVGTHWDWHSTSDWALTEFEAQRIGDHFPLVGSFSRLGWSHPGPAFTLLMALGHGATQNSAGMLLAMLFLQVGSLIVAWFSARALSSAAAILAGGSLMLTWALASARDEILLPWNPTATLVAAGSFVTLAIAVALRARLGALLLLPCASFLVQAHLGSALLAVAVALTAIALGLVRAGQTQRTPWSWWGAGIAVTVLMWIPPLIDQFSTPGGNLTGLLTSQGGERLGPAAGLSALSGAFALPPYWSDAQGWLPLSPTIPLLLALPAVATAVAVAGRHANGLRALAVCWAAVVAIAPSVALADQRLAYLVQWVPAVVAITCAISLGVIASATNWEGVIVRLAPILLVGPACLVAAGIVLNEPPAAAESDAVGASVDAFMATDLRTSGAAIVLPPGASWAEMAVAPGLAVALSQEGVAISPPHAEPPSPLARFSSDAAGRPEIALRLVDSRSAPTPGWRVVQSGETPSSGEGTGTLRWQLVVRQPDSTG